MTDEDRAVFGFALFVLLAMNAAVLMHLLSRGP
jgi:hypothetical protein